MTGSRIGEERLGAILAAAFSYGSGCGETRPVPPQALEPAQIATLTRPATVLLVEGPLRFDTRRIQGMLIESTAYNYQTLLFAPKQIAVLGSPMVVQSEAGPDLPKLAGFPTDLSRYDAILLGDADPSDLGGRPAVERLADYVRAGGGLILICGRRHTPASYLATPLGELLPFDRAGGYLQQEGTLQLTEEGRKHPLTRLVPDPAANTELWKEIGGLTGFVRVRDVADPSAVLVEASFPHDPVRAPHRRVREPILLASRAGRGRIAIFLTDTLYAVQHGVTAQNYLTRIYEPALGWVRRAEER